MKLPKTVMRLCPTCRKHTEHKISTVKKHAASSLKHGSKFRARLRGKARGFGNWGRYSKPAITQWKMTGSKVSKKTDLRYECTQCKKMHVQRAGFRTKKLEITEKQ